MKKRILISIIMIAAMALPCFLMAQGIPEDPSDTMVPIDGGLSILLGAAAAYGSHKIKKYRNK